MEDRRTNYRAWNAERSRHQSVSPHDALPADGLVFFLLDLILEMDIAPFRKHYAREMRSQPIFVVTMMATLLVYACCVGVCSSRKIAAAWERKPAFRAVVGNDPPDHRTIGHFRKIRLAALRPLLLDVLRLDGEMRMVEFANLSTDGAKMGANASRQKAMSNGYKNKEMERMEAENDQLLKRAEQFDGDQDAAPGSRRGHEMPEESKRREERTENPGGESASGSGGVCQGGRRTTPP